MSVISVRGALFDCTTGAIDVTELVRFGVARQKLRGSSGPEWTEENALRLINKGDGNGDEKLSEEEFVRYWLKNSKNLSASRFNEMMEGYLEAAALASDAEDGLND